MRRPRRKLEVNTFPFLAVLLCAMGSFILLLMVIDRRAKIVSQNKARDAYLARKLAYEAENEAALKEVKDRNDRLKANWQAQKDKIHAELQAEEDALSRQITQLLAALAKTDDALVGEKTKSNSLARKVDLEDVALKALQKELLSRHDELERAKQISQGHLKLREQLSRDLVLLEAALRNVQERKSRESPVYSLVPYKGKHGASSKPVYIEASGGTVAIHPGPTTLTPIDMTPDAFRRAIEERTGPLEKEVIRPGMPPRERDDKPPYLLFLVRPSGISIYYESLQALRGYRVDFGYELVEADWVFDFSDGKVDQQPWRNVAKIEIEPSNVTRPTPKGMGPRVVNLGGGHEAGAASGGAGSGASGNGNVGSGATGGGASGGSEAGSGQPRAGALGSNAWPGGIGLGSPGVANGPGQLLGGTSLRAGNGNGYASGPGGGQFGQGPGNAAGLPSFGSGLAMNGAAGGSGQPGAGALGDGTAPGGIGLGSPGIASVPGQALGGASLRPGGGIGNAGGPGGGQYGQVPGNAAEALRLGSGFGNGGGIPGNGTSTQTAGTRGAADGPSGSNSGQGVGNMSGNAANGPGNGTGIAASSSGYAPGLFPASVPGAVASNQGGIPGAPGVPGSGGASGGFGGSSYGQANLGGTGSGGSGGTPGSGPGNGDSSQAVSGQPGAAGNNPGNGQANAVGGTGVQGPGNPTGGSGGLPTNLTINLNPQAPDQPPAPRPNGSPSPSDNPLSFRNVGPQTTSPNPPGNANNSGGGSPNNSGEPYSGGGGRPRAPGDPEDGEPGPRVGNSPFLPAEKQRSGPRLPALGRLTGNRDFVLTVECFDNKVVLTPPGRTFDLNTPDAVAQLTNLIKNLVDRRQNSVRPGEPPYRPLLHFRVQADGRRTYYGVYPRLAEFGFPMSRETPD